MGIIAGNVVRCTWEGRCFLQQILFQLDYVCVQNFSTGTSVPQDLNTIMNAIAPVGAFDLTTPYLSCVPPQYTLSQIRTQMISPGRSAYVGLNGGAAPGTNANAATVANDSAAITVRTDLAGRSQVGTKKIGPVGDGARVGGKLSVLYIATLNTLATQMLVPMGPFGGNPGQLMPVIFHRATGLTNRITDVIIGTTARVKVKRTVGVGD